MLLLSNVNRLAVHRLLDRYGLELVLAGPDTTIRGSYWGGREAGLVGSRLYARADTPIHSLLHETAHYICMSAERRVRLDTDAHGDHAEESAVCYLQILLAEQSGLATRAQMFADMDQWGYSFRLGRTEAWFAGDAAESQAWLADRGIVDSGQRLTFRCR